MQIDIGHQKGRTREIEKKEIGRDIKIERGHQG